LEMVELEDQDWQKKLRKTIIEEAWLTPGQTKNCLQHIKKTFKERVGEKTKKAARKVVKDQQELEKYMRSTRTLSNGHRFWVGLPANVHCTVQIYPC
jgi:hypothetical protein